MLEVGHIGRGACVSAATSLREQLPLHARAWGDVVICVSIAALLLKHLFSQNDIPSRTYTPTTPLEVGNSNRNQRASIGLQQAEHRLLAMVIIYTSASGGLVRESPLLIVIAAKLMSRTCKADAKIKRSVA